MGIFDKLFKTTQVNSLPEKSIPLQKREGSTQIYREILTEKVEMDLRKRYIAFDVETTGLNPTKDRIVEVGAMIFENGKIVDSYTSLINAGLIGHSASAVNQITNDMISRAPSEEVVYSELVNFLGNALNNQTLICAYNAGFDMKFLAKSLMRLGYNAKISYVDVLPLARQKIDGLDNYKQKTVAEYFNLVNEQAHRAMTDAEICGKMLWMLLKIEYKIEEKRNNDKYYFPERVNPSDEEKEICAFIQNCIVARGGDTEFLDFHKNSSNYIDITYLYTILKFKITRKKKYIIIDKSIAKKINLCVESCTKTEGERDYVRFYFDNPFELECLSNYIFQEYKRHRDATHEFFKYNQDCKRRIKTVKLIISPEEVETLLVSAKERIIQKETEERICYEKEQRKKLEKKEKALQKEDAKKALSNAPRKKITRPVLQYSNDMSLIKRHESIADAVRETHVNSKSIRDAAKGVQKHAGGFIWKYAETDILSL